ncbi:hypothetical protein BRC2024_PQPTKSFJ_CDS_0108 [Tegunavirus sp. BRC001]
MHNIHIKFKIDLIISCFIYDVNINTQYNKENSHEPKTH